MKISNVFLGFIALAAVSCGTKDKDENTPAPVTQQVTSPTASGSAATPVATTTVVTGSATPNTTVANAPEATTVAIDSSELEDNETVNQTDYSLMDPYGTRYDLNADIPYDVNFGQPAQYQYDASSTQYFNEVDGYTRRIYQPMQNYVTDFERPYLAERYSQHRVFINYSFSFAKVKAGVGPWDELKYKRMKMMFARSRRWVNYDCYNLVNRTLTMMSKRNFHSASKLEDRIRDAMRRRSHFEMIKLHDALLDEAKLFSQKSGRGGRDRDRDYDREIRGYR